MVQSKRANAAAPLRRAILSWDFGLPGRDELHGGPRLKTPLNLQALGVPELCPAKRIWRGHYAYRRENGDKASYLATMLALENSGALAQIGDPAKNVDRVKQAKLAEMQGVTRATVTRRLGRLSAPERCPKCGRSKIVVLDSDRLLCSSCTEVFAPRWDAAKRKEQSRKMKEITAIHPRWNPPIKIDAQTRRTNDAGVVGGAAAAPPVPAISPEPGAGGLMPPKRVVGCIITRNPAFGAPNTYSFGLPEAARPKLKADPDPRAHAAILADHFGDTVYDREAAVNGFRKAWGWNFDPRLPDAVDCSCRRQPRIDGSPCEKCKGQGFVVGGSMPDYGRVLLHWLNDRGIDQEIRRCAACKRTYSQDSTPAWPKCPGCESVGSISKHRGILEGWTQAQIAEANGLDVSTVRRYFTSFRRLGLIRTVYGKIWRECCGSLYDQPACPKCGNKIGTIKFRDPWKILWLPSRTLDREMAKAEEQRLDALLRWHRKFADADEQKRLQDAVALAKNLLAEWIGKEHQMASYYAEMRRRLANSRTAAAIPLLFPDTS